MGEPIVDESAILRLPLGYTTMSKLRKDDVIYVDKTELIGRLGKIRATPVFLSRPRRFGKSLLVSIFESLFSRGLADFSGLDIENDKFWKNEKTYKVIRLDFSAFASRRAEECRARLSVILQSALKDKDPEDLTEAEKSLDPGIYLERYSRKAEDESLVLLIDEYDCPITHNLDSPSRMKEMIDFLSEFFAVIKSCESVFRFVFITGITRLAHVSLFSIFNNLEDITADDDYATLLGITEGELHEYFDPYVRNAAAVLDISADAVYSRLKSTYDGFQFSINKEVTVYNPWSVLSFLKKPQYGFRNYWYSAGGGTPRILVDYLKDRDNLELFNMLRYRIGFSENAGEDENESEKEDESENIKTFVITERSLLTKSDPDQIPMNMLLLQMGYFTLKKVGQGMARMVIANDEIAESLIWISFDIQNMQPSFKTLTGISRLPEFIDNEDVASVFKLFNALLCECVSSNSKAFSDENTVRDIIYSQIPWDNVFKAKEVNNSHGFSDLELKTPSTRLVIEFKRIDNDNREEQAMQAALNQLESRHYGETSENIRVIRAGMVISTKKRCLSSYRVL